MAEPLDTNVVLRYFVEDPEAEAYRDVFRFFAKVERGERRAMLPPLVLFQSYFVLTGYYEVPRTTAAGQLREPASIANRHHPRLSGGGWRWRRRDHPNRQATMCPVVG